VSAALLVIAKAPAPGRSKTRLCPPCTPEEAALLAAAALMDTLEAGTESATFGRRVLVLDGTAGFRLPAGWEVLPQRGAGLDERLGNAFVDAVVEAGEAALLVGMDTPQLTPALLDASAETLLAPGVGAVLGPAIDGGYWAIGLREPDAAVFQGVPMSTTETLTEQRRRLHGLGIAPRELPTLRDVDTFEDAVEVASSAPGSRFARALAHVTQPLASGIPS
jgi:rSAM/selenodomain-associated transferase 1